VSAPVVDCSTTAAWVLADEQSRAADVALDEVVDRGALVPAHWWLEIRNVLIRAERLGRIVPADTTAALSLLKDLRIQLDHTPRDAEVMRLARTCGLTAYDAVYLDLALRDRRSFATLDRKLAKAARSVGVEVIGDAPTR